ncbi:MAG TPA: hypothetical protein VHD84_00435 [Candidatus Saccharimonadales bacterium]|nr:hypothetical protein [Candidatus Saccharimonadales bacterium]
MAKHNWTDDLSGPSTKIKRLEGDVRQVLRRTDESKLDRKYRSALTDLRQNLVDIRIYVNAYEFSEERQEQLSNAKLAKKYLSQARQNILKASEADVFGPADVAQSTALIDQLKAELI